MSQVYPPSADPLAPVPETDPPSAGLVLHPSDLFPEAMFVEYARLQEQCAHEREARDHRVNWYTLIIGGVVAGYGAWSSQFAEAFKDPSLRTFMFVLGMLFMVTVGWEVFEAAQRFNLNAIACLFQMQRIRSVLSELEPALATRLKWKAEPDLLNRRPLSVPTVTVTINSFLACVIAAIGLSDRLVTPVWQTIAVFVGILAAGIQCLFARVRYQRLVHAFEKSPDT